MTDARISRYLLQLQSVLAALPEETIERIALAIHTARLDGRTVFIVGNGGSAATASHWANDLCKFTRRESLPPLRALALTDNVPLITAWANDAAYADIFVEQMANFVQAGDVVIAISGSGNSPNVLNAVRFARTRGAISLGLTGFDGGRLKDLADVCLVVSSNSMQQVEDAHMILSHLISTILADTPAMRVLEPGLAMAFGRRSRAVFLDRDGVINENQPSYVKSWSEFHFIPGALDALARLAASDYRIVIVTNQSAIGRGLVAREAVEEIHSRMLDAIQAAGGRVDAVLYCPHRPEENCTCRKPRTDLLHRAAEQLDLNLSQSWLVGDSVEDMQAGISAGCETILVKTGRGRAALAKLGNDAPRVIVASALSEAVDWIMARDTAPASLIPVELSQTPTTVGEVMG